MMSSIKSSSVVVFTTHERSGYFTSVLGENIDLKLHSHNCSMLENVLHNALIAGASLVIIDDAAFLNLDDLAEGLGRFLVYEKHPQKLKLIVVCTRRVAGDSFLAYLVTYCRIYNIIYGKSGVEVSLSLCELMKRENTFNDVIKLAEPCTWKNIKHTEELYEAELRRNASDLHEDTESNFSFDVAHTSVSLDVGYGRTINLNLDVSGECSNVNCSSQTMV